jgi:hypothetical protein
VAHAPDRERGWLVPADVVGRLRKRWDRGEFLADLAVDSRWAPVSVGLRPPTAADVAADHGAVERWIEIWRRFARTGPRLEWCRVGGRLTGVNEVPSRVWIDEPDVMWRVLDVRSEVAGFVGNLQMTRARRPDLEAWVATHPMAVVAVADVWPQMLAVVDWVDRQAAPDVYLRQIDVAGVDTKFVERHRGLFADLLDQVLPPERIDSTVMRNRFLERYRFARKPSYVRLRRLDGTSLLTGTPGPAELGMRVEDLARLSIPAQRVFVVENDVTYLALPPLDGALAILGEGYAVTRLSTVTWLADRDLAYWSDLDTHGFVMLDRLRAHFPAARSMLMDLGTLLDHEAHWGIEDTPVNRPLDRLTPDENSLYRDLVECRYGQDLRLEQERIRFGAVRRAMT